MEGGCPTHTQALGCYYITYLTWICISMCCHTTTWGIPNTLSFFVLLVLNEMWGSIWTQYWMSQTETQISIYSLMVATKLSCQISDLSCDARQQQQHGTEPPQSSSFWFKCPIWKYSWHCDSFFVFITMSFRNKPWACTLLAPAWILRRLIEYSEW